MVKKRTIYTTSDGKEFDNEKEAKEHDENLSKMRRLLSGSLHILQEMLLRIRTTVWESNRART